MKLPWRIYINTWLFDSQVSNITNSDLYDWGKCIEVVVVEVDLFALTQALYDDLEFTSVARATKEVRRRHTFLRNVDENFLFEKKESGRVGDLRIEWLNFEHNTCTFI